MTVQDFVHLMDLVRFVCAAANALTSSGVTIGGMEAIVDDLRQKLEEDKK